MNKLRFNKKGEQESGFGETGNWIRVGTMAIFAIIFGGILLGAVSNSIAGQLTAEKNVEEFLTFEAIRHCFLYEENGRVYYDAIDRTKFTDERLAECLPESRVSARLATPEGLVIETAEHGMSAIVGTTGYTYNVNVYGEGLHKLTVRMIRE